MDSRCAVCPTLVLAAILLVASPAAAQMTAAETLQTAVAMGNPAAIEAAIRAGGDPRAVDEKEGSLLAKAALFGKAQSVRILLEHGCADPGARGPNGGNALNAAFFAINGGQILGRGDEPDPARRAEGVEVVRLIAARKIGLDVPVKIATTNMTPLMQAAQAGALDLVQIPAGRRRQSERRQRRGLHGAGLRRRPRTDLDNPASGPARRRRARAAGQGRSAGPCRG